MDSLLEDTLKTAKDLEENGPSQLATKQSAEQQVYFNEVNRLHREMIARWRREIVGSHR